MNFSKMPGAEKADFNHTEYADITAAPLWHNTMSRKIRLMSLLSLKMPTIGHGSYLIGRESGAGAGAVFLQTIFNQPVSAANQLRQPADLQVQPSHHCEYSEATPWSLPACFGHITVEKSRCITASD